MLSFSSPFWEKMAEFFQRSEKWSNGTFGGQKLLFKALPVLRFQNGQRILKMKGVGRFSETTSYPMLVVASWDSRNKSFSRPLTFRSVAEPRAGFSILQILKVHPA